MKARVTIDQIASSGGTQRYGPIEIQSLQLDAVVEEGLGRLGLNICDRGHYQITVVDLGLSAPYDTPAERECTRIDCMRTEPHTPGKRCIG